jgi:hypothetical protein
MKQSSTITQVNRANKNKNYFGYESNVSPSKLLGKPSKTVRLKLVEENSGEVSICTPR